jgi:regulator of cell morphogenesis and NO signaling
MPAPSQTQTIGELVRDNPARARVFETLGIDYCCGGKVPLDSACREHNLDPEQVQRQLDEIDAEVPDTGEGYATMSLTDLADHVESRHHAYLREELPRIEYLAGRVANAHGERDPRLVRVRDILASFSAEMLDHMAKEEQVLFPSIRELESGDAPASFGFGSIANPIRQMEADHDNSGDALAQVRELTDGFASSSAACNTHLALLDALVTLERDTHEHVHKENNILFPSAIRLEESRANAGGV